MLQKDDETIDDLQINNIKIIQKKKGFRFGEDSVFLANYVASFYSKKNHGITEIADLGCNCGAVSLLLSQKISNSRITGVEITEEAFNIFIRNIENNGLQNQIKGIRSDWNELYRYFSAGSFGCVVSNPPYMQYKKDDKKDITDIIAAKHEVFSTAGDLMKITSHLLRQRGMCFFVYRVSRLSDVIHEMKNHRLEPRRIRFITPRKGDTPVSFIIAGQKDVKSGGFVLESPLVVLNEDNRYTEEVSMMYGKNQSGNE